MFSMTTIASSTTSPVASVSPNSVIVLIEKPKIFITKNVPTSETGIVTAGISVERGSCKKDVDDEHDEEDRQAAA